MSIVTKQLSKEIWKIDQPNDYSSLNDLKDKYGVYIFRDLGSKVLYVGEARKQDLKTRVTQNFSEKDTGGTFRKNFISNTSGSFESFKKAMESVEILFITSEKNNGMLIRALESLLILLLKPSHNKDA